MSKIKLKDLEKLLDAKLDEKLKLLNSEDKKEEQDLEIELEDNVEENKVEEEKPTPIEQDVDKSQMDLKVALEEIEKLKLENKE
ncbi:MAG: hypothetical protein ACK5MR_17600 [Cumulibacter sp.]